MTETIYRHTCDGCGKIQDESAKTGFLPCGGTKNWSAWSIREHGTASKLYSASTSDVEFCSYECLAEWAKGRISWNELTT